MTHLHVFRIWSRMAPVDRLHRIKEKVQCMDEVVSTSFKRVFLYGFSHGSTLKIRFWTRLEGTTPYNAKPQETTEPLDRLMFPVIWSCPMLFGVAAHKRF